MILKSKRKIIEIIEENPTRILFFYTPLNRRGLKAVKFEDPGKGTDR
jgi:hypothetical protein